MLFSGIRCGGGGSQDDVDESKECDCAAGPLVGLVVLDGYSWKLAVIW